MNGHMNVVVSINDQTGVVTVRIPNRGDGTWRTVLDDLTMLDLLQLVGAANKAIEGLSK